MSEVPSPTDAARAGAPRRRWNPGVSGMHCTACEKALCESLLRVPGVDAANSSFTTESVSVLYDPDVAEVADLERAVLSAGYGLRESALAPGAPASGNGLTRKQESRRELQWAIVAGLFAAPLALLHHAGGGAVGWPAFALATGSLFTAGLTFFRGSYHAMRSRAANMDVLVALGISAAWGYSTLVWFLPGSFPGPGFFAASAMLIFFIRIGKYLEARARGRTSRALRELLELQVPTATLVEEGGDREVPVEQITVGDLVRVRAGGRIPVDGVITEGSSAIDESMLTGESVPVGRSPGDDVAGSTLVADGQLLVRATRPASESALGRIVAMVADAQRDRAPIQRIADRLAEVFVPIVCALATITFLVWFGLSGAQTALGYAIAVLVIACPCALGLATPTAILVGSGVGLRRGILIKRASALEALAQVEIVACDKTGTLTAGAPEVTAVEPATGVGAFDLLVTAASLEQASDHPLARAIVLHASTQGATAMGATEVVELAGVGIHGLVAGRRVAVGGAGVLRALEWDAGELATTAEALAAKGATPVLVARAGLPLGVFGLADTVHPTASAAVGALDRMGIETHILSGDVQPAVQRAGAELGLRTTHLHAAMTPADKIEWIRQARSAGRRVAMVGDGINDAPALAAATVGLAIGAGAEVAIEAGDVVLTRGDLRDVSRAIALGRSTLRKVKQNLWWALVYNVVGIPVAAGVFAAWIPQLPPAWAGAAMALSSLSVVLSSLWLNRVDKDLDAL